MNKIISFLLKLSGIMAGLGIILLVIGVSNGGMKKIKNIKLFENNGIHLNVNSSNEMWDTLQAENKFSADEISGIYIDANECQIGFEKADSNDIVVECQGDLGGYTENQDGILSVVAKSQGDNTSSEDELLVIYIPEGKSFDSIYVEVGAGRITANTVLKCDEANFQIGAVNAILSELDTNNLIVNLDMGELIVSDGSVDNAQIDVNMGDFRYKGRMDKDLNAECNMGNIYINLLGNNKDFNYECETSMGSINVGDINCNGLFSSKNQDNESDKNMNIECRMGSVEVIFI